MSGDVNAGLQRTPFFSSHQAAGARIVNFGGWEMPVQFAGIMQEHAAVRERAGVFDISHMGQVWVTGKDSLAYLQRLLSNDIAKAVPGKGQYNLMCREDGGVIDDLFVYCLAPEKYFVVINASHIPVDLQWMRDHAEKFSVSIEERPERAGLALQGPKAVEIAAMFAPGAAALPRNGVAEFPIGGGQVVVSRTGYTGEDGVEFFGPASALLKFYPELLAKGKALGLEPCGLGARDTLRLEMGYRLHGNDLDERHTALESGLGWAIKLDKGDFVGRDSMLREKAKGPARRFIAFKLNGAGVARHGYPIVSAGRPVGEVTSGTFSPSLKAAVGVGFIAATVAADAPLAVRVHDREVPLEITSLPFYRKEAAATSK